VLNQICKPTPLCKAADKLTAALVHLHQPLGVLSDVCSVNSAKLHDCAKQQLNSPLPLYICISAFVYFVMLLLRPPHRPLSEVTATVMVFGGSMAAAQTTAEVSTQHNSRKERQCVTLTYTVGYELLLEELAACCVENSKLQKHSLQCMATAAAAALITGVLTTMTRLLSCAQPSEAPAATNAETASPVQHLPAQRHWNTLHTLSAALLEPPHAAALLRAKLWG
jgi:hypothetical protein